MGRAPHERRAFTLVEVLVAMTVLILILVVTAQIVNSTATLTESSNQHMDADSQARFVFDRMAFDFGQMVKRPDVDFYFKKTAEAPGDDQMAFYSETTGYYPTSVIDDVPKSPITVTGYRIHNHQLERLAKGLVWNGVKPQDNVQPMTYLPAKLTTTWPAIADDGADPDYQLFGDQVFRLEYCFLLKDKDKTYLSDQPYLAATGSVSGMKDVVAVVVAIAILDNKSRTNVQNQDLAAAATKLASVSGSTITDTPAKLWEAQLQNGDLGLPRSAAARVRVYQRYFYLNN